MRTIAILPIKRFGAAKQRLSGLLGADARQALVQAMFEDVLASLRQIDSLDAIVVVTANPAAERVARAEGVAVLEDSEETGHNEAAGLGIAYALEHGFERALLVPADTPLVDTGEIEQLLRDAASDRSGLVVIPDRHGAGTNALAIAPPGALAPSFGPGSRARHERLAATAGISCRVAAVPSLAVDVDTPEDLDELIALLRRPADRSRARMTRDALAQLDRWHAEPPVPPAAVS
jgi:2-phospho-L-lactate guanylyltransferase